MKTMTLGGLTTRISGEGDGPIVVLLHGFGAPGDDLVSLADVIEAPAGTRFVFPAAPNKLEGGWGDARAWWMIDMEALEEALESGKERDLTRQVPEGLAEARARLTALVDELPGKLGAGPLVLGGFSQGAMLSTDVALHIERPLAGLILMSGTYLAEHEWQPLMARRAGLRVFQSHGTGDPILPYKNAELLRDALGAAGAWVDWVSFKGAHTIPPAVIAGVSRFIQDVTR